MKKAQVTIFILIGVVMLLAAGLIFYLMQDSAAKESREGIFKGQVAEFSGRQQAQGIVEACLKDTVNEGLLIMQAQGGFIEFPSRIRHTLWIPNDYEIYFEDGTDGLTHKRVRKANDSMVEVPYYVTAFEGDLSPTVAELEAQLEDYINTELKYCVKGWVIKITS